MFTSAVPAALRAVTGWKFPGRRSTPLWAGLEPIETKFVVTMLGKSTSEPVKLEPVTAPKVEAPLRYCSSLPEPPGAAPPPPDPQGLAVAVKAPLASHWAQLLTGEPETEATLWTEGFESVRSVIPVPPSATAT